MRRETQNVVLLLVGVALAMVTVTGAYTRYVKPGMLPWLIGSAAILIALAILAMASDIRGTVADGPGHHHHGERDGVVWLLVLPIVMLIFIVPPALSAQAASPVTVATSSRSPFPPLPPGGAPAVALPQVLMRIATGPAGGLDGRTISVTGVTMKDHENVDLAKIVIICCAADAQLARLHLAGPAAAAAGDLPDNTWITVRGTIPAGQTYRGTSSIPTIAIDTLTRIDPPTNSYG